MRHANLNVLATPALLPLQKSAMALARGLGSLKASVLNQVRLTAQGSIAQQSLGAACSLNLYRAFAEGTYLDKSQVTDRIISVTKNFGKADTSKVRSIHQANATKARFR